MIFKLWVEHYLHSFKRNKVKNSTFKFYFEILKEIKPLFDIDIGDLNIFDIQNLINNMSDEGLSYATIKHTYSLIDQACRKAVSCKIISHNPCNGAELPKQEKKDINCLSAFEVRQLACSNEKTIYYNVFMFLLYSGMRVGELIALDWSDIDFKNRVIHINKNFYRGDLSTPKTEQSKRDIPLTDELLSLMPLRSVFDSNRQNIVFTNTLGCRLDYHTLLRSWHRQQNHANFINCYGLHALRHTFATNLIHNGADTKTVSLLLGHKHIQTTLDFYIHSDLNEKREVISKLNYNVF